MILFGKSILLTKDLGRFQNVKTLLEANNIKYKTKVENSSAVFTGQGTTRGMNFGRDTDITYEILVDKKDAESAEFLMRNEI